MAVDTAAKRFAIMNLDGSDVLVFEPDGAVDTDDRAMLVYLYGGIALDAPTITYAIRKTLPAVGTKIGSRQVHKSAVKG